MNFQKHFGIKKQPFSFSTMRSLKPAPIPLQQQWSNMSKPEKIVNRLRFRDFDRDGVPNKWDCQPMNILQQEFTPNRTGYSEVTARRRFGHQNLQGLQRIGQGRDREVYAIDNDKVLKIAKNPGGLTQNEKEQYLQELGQIKHYESGKDYVVMQRANPPGKATVQFLRPLKKAANTTSYAHDFLNTPEVQSTITNENEGFFADLPNYESGFNPQELTAKRQWGEIEGKPVLIDAGALTPTSDISRFRVKHFQQISNVDKSRPIPWQLKEWQEVQRERQQYGQPKWRLEHRKEIQRERKQNYPENPGVGMQMFNEEKKFTDPILPRYPGRGYHVKYYKTDDLLKKHAELEPEADITKPENQIGNRLENAKEFIKEKKYMTEDWPGGGIGGFQPTLIGSSGRISDGRHRLLALKQLGYTEVPVEEEISKEQERNEREAVWKKVREEESAKREERREKGLCADCGKNPRTHGALCDDCSEAFDDAQKGEEEYEKRIMKSNQAFADEVDYITDSENENRTFTTGQFETPEIPEDSLFKDKENWTTEGFTPKKDVVYLPSDTPGYEDNDGDGVINAEDCCPDDAEKQGWHNRLRTRRFWR
jgi:hypothetical protein